MDELIFFMQIEEIAGAKYLRDKYFIDKDKLGNYVRLPKEFDANIVIELENKLNDIYQKKLDAVEQTKLEGYDVLRKTEVELLEQIEGFKGAMYLEEKFSIVRNDKGDFRKK